MRQTNIDSKCITNAALFELENYKNLEIPEELKDFLMQKKNPWQALKELQQFLLESIKAVPDSQRRLGKVSPHAVLENPESIVIAEGAVVEPFAYLSGPLFIGPGAVVRQGAYLRGNVYVGAQAVVGHTTECKNVLMLPKAKAAHFNYLGDSILGVDTNLGAGTKLANLKFDHRSIVLRIDGEKVDTGLKKFGAILGNRAQTGCNSVTNPGTIMLPDSALLPNATGGQFLLP